MNRPRNFLLFALLFWLLVCFSSTTAFASHLRGTSVSWQPTTTPGTVRFTIQYSQRTSQGGCNVVSACSVGSTISVPFNFGDGSTGTFVATVTSLNAADDYFAAVGTVNHTYAAVGPYTAYYYVSARVSTIKSGQNQYLRMETTVTPFGTNHPPVSGMPAIVVVPLRPTTTFQVTAADQDADVLTYRLATAQEQYGTASDVCIAQQPPGLSISNTGLVTWDTTQIRLAGCSFTTPISGDLWTVQFMIEDHDGNNVVKSKTPVDILLELITSTETPPTLLLSNPGPITVSPGTLVTFTATGNDVDANSRVTLNATGLPLGATASNTNQSLLPPVASTFSWTPTTAQAGSYVVSYTATNDTFEQVLSSVTIHVTSILPPVLACAVSVTSQYNATASIPLQVFDPQGDAITVVWTIGGTPVQTDNVATSTTTTNLALNQTFMSVGPQTVIVTATNSNNLSSTCSIPVTVTKADQNITFSSIPAMTYGGADAVLTATAASGLPVIFTTSGACSVVNGALHATGAGSCTITAMQAGNVNYNAATNAAQTFTITPRTLTVIAQNSTRVFGTGNPSFTGTITGVLSGDVITAVYATTATVSSASGPYAIVPTVSGAALPNYIVSATNGTLTVTPAPTTLAATTPSSIVAGGNVGIVTTRVVDNSGQTATSSSALITAVITGPNGYSHTISGTASNGVASFNMASFVLTTAGNYTVTYTSPGLVGITSALTVTPGSASKLAAIVPNSVVSGGSLGAVPVTIEDTNSNAVNSSSATVTATITGPNGYSQTVVGIAVNGVANLNFGSLLTTAGPYMVTTTSPGLTGSTSILTVSSGTSSKIVTAVKTSIVSGGSLGTLVSTVEDSAGNTVVGSSTPLLVNVAGPNGFSQNFRGGVVNGVMTLDLNSLSLTAAGSYVIAVSGSGLSPSTSTLAVTPGAASKIVLGSVVTAITSGQSLGAVMATVQDANGNTVTGFNGPVTAILTGPGGFAQTVIGTAVNGLVSLDFGSMSPSTAGSYVVTATASGVAAASASVTVNPASQTIPLPDLPNLTYGAGSTTLPLASTSGLPIVYTVTGPAVLKGSSLTVTGAGTVTIVATQTGDASHNPTSISVSFVVAPAATTTTLSTSSGVATTGTPITLTAQVSSAIGTPTGTITFLDGSTVLGTAAVSPSGTGSLTLSALPTGGLSLTAAYSGNTNYVTSGSAAQLTNIQDFAIAALSGTPSTSIVPGTAAIFTLALNPGASGFSSSITLTATGLPVGAAYSFSPATITPGSTQAGVAFTVQTSKPLTMMRNVTTFGITIALLAAPFGLSRRNREMMKKNRVLGIVAGVLLLTGIAALTGCGTNNGFFGEPAHSYTITVTAVSGTLSHSTTVVLNVQ